MSAITVTSFASIFPDGAGTPAFHYEGLGILGSDVPSSGDEGGSFLLDNLDFSLSAEYSCFIETAPGAGTFTLYPDSSFTFEDAPDGQYQADVRIYENGAYQGLETIELTVGVAAFLVAAANLQQQHAASSVAISQTALVSGAASQSTTEVSAAHVTDTLTAFVSASASDVVAIAESAAIAQTHIVVSTPAAADNIAAASAIVQTHLVSGSMCSQENRCSAASLHDDAVTIGTVFEAVATYVDRASFVVNGGIRMPDPIIVTGDHAAIPCQLHVDGAPINMSGASVLAAIVSRDRKTVYCPAVGQSEAASGADWATGKPIIEFAPTDTAGISFQGPVFVEIQVDTGKKATWWVKAKLRRGNIA